MTTWREMPSNVTIVRRLDEGWIASRRERQMLYSATGRTRVAAMRSLAEHVTRRRRENAEWEQRQVLKEERAMSEVSDTVRRQVEELLAADDRRLIESGEYVLVPTVEIEFFRAFARKWLEQHGELVAPEETGDE